MIIPYTSSCVPMGIATIGDTNIKSLWFDATAGTTTLNTAVDLTNKTVDVLVNGVLQRQGATYDYTISTLANISTITFTWTLPVSSVCVRYY